MEATTVSRGPAAVRSRDAGIPAERPESARVPEPIADPAPLGLAAFALTTFVLSFFNAGWVNDAGEPIVFGLAFAYGGLAQVLAGMWEFKNNNTFGATAFTSFGAFWLSLFAFEQFFAGNVPEAAVGDAVGLYLIAWGIFTAYMWIASFRVSVAVNIVFLLLAPTFILLGIGDAGGNETITHIGGYLGVATAIAAWYASFAGVTNKTFGRDILPVRPLK
jgi:succinate-acetate transporter protein